MAADTDLLRSLPQVDVVLRCAAAVELIASHGNTSVSAAVRLALDGLRKRLLVGEAMSAEDLSPERIVLTARSQISIAARPTLQRVVNATGVMLHTGLGRAAMPPVALDALAGVLGYCNVQMDLQTGGRVRREINIVDPVSALTGAEDALLVNNNAGATLLTLKALAENMEVIISRGELIEIGGSFRLPDIMAQSGAVMREVGTTNRTRLSDYANAVGERTALIMRASKSNYEIVGFAEEVPVGELTDLGRQHGVPVVDDLGCGAMVDTELFGAPHETTVRESIEAGADVVLVSTDKLIGGPQGGLIVGRRDLLDRIRRHPLYRALRVGKLTLASVEATLRLFLEPELLPVSHPLYGMIAKTMDDMQAQADSLVALLRSVRPTWQITVVEHASCMGGGSLPGKEMEAVAVEISSPTHSAELLACSLRTSRTPVVPYIRGGKVLLSMRTVAAEDVDVVVEACRGT